MNNLSKENEDISKSPEGYIPIFNKISLVSNIWLVSFGDLLTLVLCFFISVISLSPLNPTINIKQQDGIELAHNKKIIQEELVERYPLNLNFTMNDLTPSGDKLSENALERIKKQVSQDSYSNEGVKLETCMGTLDENTRDTWDQSVMVLNNIRSQVFDSSGYLENKKALLRVLATDCAENTVARLVLDK